MISALRRIFYLAQHEEKKMERYWTRNGNSNLSLWQSHCRKPLHELVTELDIDKIGRWHEWINKGSISHHDTIREILVDEWLNVSVDFVNELIGFMPCHFAAVIAANESKIKWNCTIAYRKKLTLKLIPAIYYCSHLPFSILLLCYFAICYPSHYCL